MYAFSLNYVGLADGEFATFDPRNKPCHEQMLDWGIEGEGDLGESAHLTGLARIPTSGGEPGWEIGAGYPGTGLGWADGSEGFHAPIFGTGAGAVIGFRGTKYF